MLEELDIASDWAADRGVDEVRGVLAGELFEPTAGRREHIRAIANHSNYNKRAATTTEQQEQQCQWHNNYNNNSESLRIRWTRGPSNRRPRARAGQGQWQLKRDYNAKQHVDIITMALRGS
jgi:hypothetical protein